MIKTNVRVEKGKQKINSAMLKRLFALANEHGVKEYEVKIIANKYGYKSRKDILVDDYYKILDEIRLRSKSIVTQAKSIGQIQAEHAKIGRCTAIVNEGNKRYVCTNKVNEKLNTWLCPQHYRKLQETIRRQKKR